MTDKDKIISVSFYRSSSSGKEPVREWLKALDKEDRLMIGADVKTAEFGWPVGMPVCRKMAGHKDLFEIRSRISSGRIARVLFFIRNNRMILLHGFIKKTQKTPPQDINTALQRKKDYENHDR